MIGLPLFPDGDANVAMQHLFVNGEDQRFDLVTSDAKGRWHVYKRQRQPGQPRTERSTARFQRDDGTLICNIAVSPSSTTFDLLEVYIRLCYKHLKGRITDDEWRAWTTGRPPHDDAMVSRVVVFTAVSRMEID